MLRIHLHGELSAQAVDDQVQLGFVTGDRHAPEYRTVHTELLELALDAGGGVTGGFKLAFVHVIGIGKQAHSYPSLHA